MFGFMNVLSTPTIEGRKNEPKNTRFRQQTLPHWNAVLTAPQIIVIFVCIGIIFLPSGVALLKQSQNTYQQVVVYDSASSDPCSISQANQGLECTVNVTINKSTVTGPLYVYYQLNNFYQNNRQYYLSVDTIQLSGQIDTQANAKLVCGNQALTNGSLLLNPCGLIAQSFFNDIITLDSALTTNKPSLDTSNIAYKTDQNFFKQPAGFRSWIVQNASSPCPSGYPTCKSYYNPSSNTYYKYLYPNQATTQYAYQTYPENINPIEGITNQNFINWMKPAAFPGFRKLLGKIDGTFHSGNVLSFNIVNNFQVRSFNAQKSIVVTQMMGGLGQKNDNLGIAYIVLGVVSLFIAGLFAIKQFIFPRDKFEHPQLTGKRFRIYTLH